MDFTKLNRVHKPQTVKKKEFDVKEFLSSRSSITDYFEKYFSEEPIRLVDSAYEFDLVNDFAVIEMESSLITCIEEHI